VVHLRRVAVGVALLVGAANVALAMASLVASRRWPVARPEVGAAGIRHLRTGGPILWACSRPGAAGYAALAAAGVRAVVDLRAERGLAPDHEAARVAGLTVLHLPVRDGQVATAEQVDEFERLLAGCEGTVYVHCSAGVGRTGSLLALHRTTTTGTAGWPAVRDALATGPPSSEQLWAIATGRSAVPLAVRAVSRCCDGPRRVAVRVRMLRAPAGVGSATGGE
jgi:protein tyrosine phosphatase (PTP) superfamily phosphohydrolase (DUF442 family)